MQSVANRAELSLATVYNFFGSKGELLYALLQQMVGRLELEMDGLWREEPLQTLLMLAETAANHYAADADFNRRLLRSVWGSPQIRGNEFDVGPSIKLYQKPVKAAISSGQLRREADAEVVARNLVVTFLGSLVLWVHEAIGNEELRIQVLYAFSLALLGVCTEESRAELLNANQRFEQQLSREFFQNRGATTERSRLIRAAKPDPIVVGVDQ